MGVSTRRRDDGIALNYIRKGHFGPNRRNSGTSNPTVPPRRLPSSSVCISGRTARQTAYETRRRIYPILFPSWETCQRGADHHNTGLADGSEGRYPAEDHPHLSGLETYAVDHDTLPAPPSYTAGNTQAWNSDPCCMREIRTRQGGFRRHTRRDTGMSRWFPWRRMREQITCNFVFFRLVRRRILMMKYYTVDFGFITS